MASLHIGPPPQQFILGQISPEMGHSAPEVTQHKVDIMGWMRHDGWRLRFAVLFFFFPSIKHPAMMWGSHSASALRHLGTWSRISPETGRARRHRGWR